MHELSNDDVEAFRKAILESDDQNLVVDAGFFLVWYANAELTFTNLLAFASGATNLATFDILCSGMDFRVKIERFRRIQRRQGGIGPNLDARLSYLNQKCRPIRNRLAHCALSRSNKTPAYLASTLGTMPWHDFGEKMPDGEKFDPPITYTPSQLLGWGAWLGCFSQDLVETHRQVRETGLPSEIEIANPRSTAP